MKNRKEKIVGIKYLNKRKYCVGTEPSALVYIGLLVTSITTDHDGSSAQKQNERVQFPVVARAVSHKSFLSSLSNLRRVSN